MLSALDRVNFFQKYLRYAQDEKFLKKLKKFLTVLPNIVRYKSKHPMVFFYFNLINKYSIEYVSPKLDFKSLIYKSVRQFRRLLISNNVIEKSLRKEPALSLSWFFYIYNGTNQEIIDLYYHRNFSSNENTLL